MVKENLHHDLWDDNCLFNALQICPISIRDGFLIAVKANLHHGLWGHNCLFITLQIVQSMIHPITNNYNNLIDLCCVISLPRNYSLCSDTKHNNNLARFAYSGYAGCEHFVSALGPSALGWGKSNLGCYLFLFIHIQGQRTD